MKRLLPTTKSIRFKFFRWYLLIWGIVFAVLGIAIIKFYEYDLNDHFDDVLTLKAQTLNASIETYLKLRRVKNPSSVMQRRDFSLLLEEWIDELSEESEVSLVNISLYAPNGILLNPPRSPLVHLPWHSPRLEMHELMTDEHFSTYRVHHNKQRSTAYRILTYPVMNQGHLRYTIRISAPLTSMAAVLKRLELGLLLIFPLTLLLTVLPTSLILADIILKPLKRLLDLVRDINAEKLSLRLEPQGGHDELSELATTFNSMLDQLEKSFQELKIFLQDCSHEIRTPLTIMRGEIEVALRYGRTTEDFREVLVSNLGEIKRLTTLVEGLLTQIRLENQVTPLTLAPVDLVPLVRALLDDITLLAQARNIQLALHLQPATLAEQGLIALVDASKITRALLNLLDNGIKYNRTDGRLDITLAQLTPHERIQITVADTGIGIAKENHQYLFQRFFRENRTPKSDGHGLGLSIARTIIMAHQGTIEVRGQENQGTVVEIQLPGTAPSP